MKVAYNTESRKYIKIGQQKSSVNDVSMDTLNVKCKGGRFPRLRSFLQHSIKKKQINQVCIKDI